MTRSRERTRGKLLDAAAQVFAEVGLDAASVEAICDRAGFTRGAFYSNFETKDELFLELAGIVARERVEAEHKRLSALGVRFTQQPLTMGPMTTAVLDDTCGNLIQIASQA